MRAIVARAADLTDREGSTVITCKKCKAEKPVDQMKVRGGKPSLVCTECADKAAAERARIRALVDEAKAEQGRKPRGKKAKAARKKESEPIEQRLTIPGGGLGIDAFITEDDRLQVQQSNGDGTDDNIVITRHEMRALFDKFGEWAVQP
jgi:hypothetical protein